MKKHQRRLTRLPDTRLTYSCPPLKAKNSVSFPSEALGDFKFSSKHEWNEGASKQWQIRSLHLTDFQPSSRFSPALPLHQLRLGKGGKTFLFLQESTKFGVFTDYGFFLILKMMLLTRVTTWKSSSREPAVIPRNISLKRRETPWKRDAIDFHSSGITNSSQIALLHSSTQKVHAHH